MQEDENKLYQQVDRILRRYPWCKADESLYEACLPDHPGIYAEPLPNTEDDRLILSQNGGIGPVPISLRVVKRLYSEGRLFQDLNKELPQIVKSYYSSLRTTAKDRIFFRYFPSELMDMREAFAGKYPRLLFPTIYVADL